MSIDNFCGGYVFDPKRARDVKDELIAKGVQVMASQQNQLSGAWNRAKAEGVTGIFLRDKEIPLLGRYRRPFLQRRGTCVSRGMCRGAQVSLDFSIMTGSLASPVELSFAPVYSLARQEIGRDRCGWDDGAILADAAKAVHDIGFATTELFNGLTENQVEQLAVKFAAPGVGTPKSWREACFGHTARVFAPDGLDLLFDTIASGYAVPYASGYITGMPDRNGLSRLGDPGGHCRCFVGLYIDASGRTQLESSESWGRYPAGQPMDQDQTMDINLIPRITVQAASGPITLAPGDVGVDAVQFWDAIENSGEAWAVGPPDFFGDSVADLTKTPAAA